MEPSEVEFLAEKELVCIIPNFSEAKICLLSGDFGPFNPSMQTSVPLWLALNLKQRQKCRIEPPSWLSVEELTERVGAEKVASTFTKMASPHYMEVASMLLNNAADDIPRADELRALVKDLWDMRLAKLRKSVDLMVTQQKTYAKLDNLTIMEINKVRELLTESLNHTHLLRLHASHHASGPDNSVV